jgi:hypothetical protein
MEEMESSIAYQNYKDIAEVIGEPIAAKLQTTSSGKASVVHFIWVI